MVITHNRALIVQAMQFKWLKYGAICIGSSRRVIKDYIEMTMHLRPGLWGTLYFLIRCRNDIIVTTSRNSLAMFESRPEVLR